MTKDRFDIHQHITNQIITSIEQGAGDFKLPWHRGGGMVSRPTNIASKKAYRGVNIVALWAASQACGFSSGIWGTYRQWSEAGAQVRKGEKSSYVVFYKELEYARAEDWADAESETRLFARATPVFAAEQVEGFNAEPASDRPEIEPIDAAEAFVRATGAAIAHGGTRAYYRPVTQAHGTGCKAAWWPRRWSQFTKSVVPNSGNRLGPIRGNRATRLISRVDRYPGDGQCRYWPCGAEDVR